MCWYVGVFVRCVLVCYVCACISVCVSVHVHVLICVHYVSVCMCENVCVTMCCPVVFISGDSSVVYYHQRESAGLIL